MMGAESRWIVEIGLQRDGERGKKKKERFLPLEKKQEGKEDGEISLRGKI